MIINNVVRFANGNTVGRNITFGRAPKKGKEEKEYSKTIQKAMDYLGIQNRALIIHAPSFPETQNTNMQIGSPYGQDEFVDFLKLHGFNAIQLGPSGKLNRGDTSPYTSSVFEKNPLFINPRKLMDKSYGSILEEKDIEDFKDSKRTYTNYTHSDYKIAQERMNTVLDIAYGNFQKKLNEKDRSVEKLNKEFTQFKKDNDSWLKYYSVLNVIAEKYGTDYYPYWSQDDRELIAKVKGKDRKAILNFALIQSQNEEKIDKYMFTQFLVDKQSKEDSANRKDFTYITDLEVGASSLDELVFSDIFLKDYKLGCKYGGPKNSPQLWGISLPNPDKLFNKDGSLGPSGQYVKLKLKNALNGAQSIRIDHAMGLVSPYIYRPDTVKYVEAKENGETITYPTREGLVADYLSNLDVDKNHNFEKIIPKIFIPTMEEMNIDPKNVVWEDLGDDPTGLFHKVFREDIGNLSGISHLKWVRGQEAKPINWTFIGCHDDKPIRKMIESGEVEGNKAWDSVYLSNSQVEARNRRKYKKEIDSSNHKLWSAKLTDLFNSTKNIQLSFMDFFGINKPYNTPGTMGNSNWSLRLSSDYKDAYYKSLEQDESYAINMPEILSSAIKAKNLDKGNRKSEKESTQLLKDLAHWAGVLKEKE